MSLFAQKVCSVCVCVHCVCVCVCLAIGSVVILKTGLDLESGIETTLSVGHSIQPGQIFFKHEYSIITAFISIIDMFAQWQTYRPSVSDRFVILNGHQL